MKGQVAHMMPTHLQAETLHIAIEVAAPVLTLRLAGELDAACVDLLRTASSVGARDVRSVVVDLSGLTFCDTAGVEALLALRSRHLLDQREVQIVHACYVVRRICEVLGAEDCLSA
jgi:anti-anti-sigma factor